VATQDDVNRACEAIAARGERPTVDRVRGELGGGSPNNLTPLVRAWHDARKHLALPIRKPAAMPEPGSLPPTLQRAFTVMTAALDATIAEITATERRQARSEIEAAAAAAQRQIEEARQQAEDERSATDAVRAEAALLERAIADKNAEIVSLLARLEAAQGTIGELRAASAAAEQKAESERQRATRAEAEAETSRQERAASEAVAREAIARAATAEGENTALRAEGVGAREQRQASHPKAKPRRGRTGGALSPE
jgi:predicted  nucleic acid-binding Zn-ribbon protein